MSSAPAKKEEPEPRFRLLTIEDLKSLPKPEWRVEGLLPESGLVELYGPPGVGKSFLALDWALSIAAGTPWQERKVREGDVIFVCAEGSSGLLKRVIAWCKQHLQEEPSRFWVVSVPVNLIKGDDAKEFMSLTRDMSGLCTR